MHVPRLLFPGQSTQPKGSLRPSDCSEHQVTIRLGPSRTSDAGFESSGSVHWHPSLVLLLDVRGKRARAGPAPQSGFPHVQRNSVTASVIVSLTQPQGSWSWLTIRLVVTRALSSKNYPGRQADMTQTALDCIYCDPFKLALSAACQWVTV